jgi:hypothetical protein
MAAAYMGKPDVKGESFLPSLQLFCSVWRAHRFFRRGRNVLTRAGAQGR